MCPVRERVEDLIGLLQENLRSYTTLLELAEEIHDEMRRGTLDGIAEKMARREQIQEEISGRDRLITGIRKGVPRILPDQRIDDLVDRSVTLATAIQGVDQRTRKLMEEEQARLREGIATLRQGRKMMRGYGKSGAGGRPRFLDRRG